MARGCCRRGWCRGFTRWGHRVALVCLALSVGLYLQSLWQYFQNYQKEDSTRRARRHQEMSQWNATKQKLWLTIGIPTVCRAKENYLSSTLSSLVNHLPGHGTYGVSIIVCICDRHRACREDIKTNLTLTFFPHVKSGLIRIIETPETLYTPLSSLKRTFNDSKQRVWWRSKQNLDYSFLMEYCAQRSQYYLHLEDDVITVPNFINKIENYMESVNRTWTMLEFSTLGFIGKFFKSRDVQRLSSLLKIFYNEQPCDYLIFYFLKLMLQMNRFIRIPSLFQHRGHFSSMPNLIRNVTEPSSRFPAFKKRFKGNNPDATVLTSMSTWMSFKPEFAYSTFDNEMFWSTTPRIGDHYTLIFKLPQKVSRLVVLTGKPHTNLVDFLHGGTLEVGTDVKRHSQTKIGCSNLSVVGKFVRGCIDITVLSEFKTIKCLKITVTKKQDSWLIIREIAVFN
ncbi:alpha-1,3-mannosyl-glycoprotein 4-beta-N-acetylglucosaminyltransferase C-like [Crassostrea virginica]